MGLYEESVSLALEKGDLELARITANMPEDDVQLRKKLWLKVARYVVEDKKDIKTYSICFYLWCICSKALITQRYAIPLYHRTAQDRGYLAVFP